MSDNTSDAAIIAELEALPMGQLRSRAAKLYSVNVTTTMTKADIIKLIKEKMSTASFAVIAVDGKPAPGWSRITLHKVPGASNHPCFVSINSYNCHIPKNIKVDVPNKVVAMLSTLKRQDLVEDFEEGLDSRVRFRWTPVDAYPVTVHDSTPGPDPKPGHEGLKEAKLRPFRAYLKQFGRWPYPKELKQVLMAGRLNGFSSLDMEATDDQPVDSLAAA